MSQKYFVDYTASYSITSGCNFKCRYCSTDTVEQTNSKIPYEKLISALKQTGKRWTVGITGGGEPLIVKNIVEACANITEEYNIILDSNLSTNSAETRSPFKRGYPI